MTMLDADGHRWAMALAIAVAGTVVLVVVNWLIRRAERRLLPHVATSETIEAARLQTTATFARRFLIAFLRMLMAWPARTLVPATAAMAVALLAPGPVIPVTL